MDRRLLLFDMDGTLVDTLPFIIECFRRAVAPLVTRSPSDEEVIATFGPAEPACLASFLRRCEREGRLRQALSDDLLAQTSERFFQCYEKGFEEGKVRLYEGMNEVLLLAREREWRLGIFTGKSRRTTESTLRHLRLPMEFDVIISGDDVTCPKPDPQGVQEAGRVTGVSSGEICVVGDSPADIQAARRAGARSAAALWGAFDPEKTRNAGADWQLESVEGLRHWLLEQ